MYKRCIRCVLSLLLSVTALPGCDTIVARPADAESERDPGPIYDLPNSWLAAIGLVVGQQDHVLMLPGIAGSWKCHDLPGTFGIDVELSLEAAASEELRQTPSTASVQIWDWTRTLDNVDFCDFVGTAFDADLADKLTDRLFESKELRRAALRLASEIAIWQAKPWNANRRLTLVCGSGGALLAVLAAEAECGGRRILQGNVFQRVVFISAALSTDRSLEALGNISVEGVYNYYSYRDATLLGYLCNPRNRVIDFAWPAAGRYGYRRNNSNNRFIAGQFAYFPDEYPTENNGAHMNGYRKEFFELLLKPVILYGTLTDGWLAGSESIAQGYEDSAQIPSTGATALPDAPALPDVGDNDLVVVIPGHENISHTCNLASLINNLPGHTCYVWDWTTFASIRALPEKQRVEPANIVPVAASFANTVIRWRASHPNRRVHLIALSSGALIASLASDANGDLTIASNTFETTILLSATFSTARSLEGLGRCTAGKIYNYYSMKNDDVVGNEADVECVLDPREGNLEERINNEFNGLLTHSVRWPPAGRFGYRRNEVTGVSSGKLLQLGWVKEYLVAFGNDGTHLSEANRQFAEALIIPILQGQAPPQWQPDVLDAYEIGDRDDQPAALESLCNAPVLK